ncbi:TPA: phosphate uptake regulator PhoU [archaeon]|nr:phosphate uptake regulator PhoU [Candidatus Undinarchaeales archaeon SRR5007147.bin71]
MAEIRKIQKTGGSTYIVSLPKKWIVRHKLSKGSSLLLSENGDGSLGVRIGKQNPKTLSETEIVSGPNIERHLLEKYLLGYDIVKVSDGKEPLEKRKKELKNTLRFLLGYEIMEEASNTIVIHNLLNPSEISISKSVRRMYTIVSVMHKDILKSLKTGSKTLLKDVAQRDEEVNRLYFLIVRQIRKVLETPSLMDHEKISASDCIDYRLVSRFIEQMGDSLQSIAESLLTLKKLSKQKQVLNYLENSYEMHQMASRGFFKKKELFALEAISLGKNIKYDKISESKDIAPIIHNIIKLNDCTQDLADIVRTE